jgi:type II pantothenate kinase
VSKSNEVKPLPLLADPAGYHACQWDLRENDERRAYWLHHFGKQFGSLLAEAVRVETSRGMTEADASDRADAARATFESYLEKLLENPNAVGRLDILTICIERERILREQGFADPYALVKQHENESALRLLPAHLAELDALESPRLEQAIIEGVFAGNIFDVGALATLELFEAGQMSFHATSCRDASSSTHWPMSRMSPVSSAIGTNSAGLTRPRVG